MLWRHWKQHIRCLSRIDHSGSTVIEFVLILPWVLLCFLAMIAAFLWVMSADLAQYTAYKGARAAQVYSIDGIDKALSEIVPKGGWEIQDPDLFSFSKTMITWFAPLQLNSYAPISFALRRETLNLSSQSEKTKWGYPRMDNFVGYCGVPGEYKQCEP